MIVAESAATIPTIRLLFILISQRSQYKEQAENGCTRST